MESLLHISAPKCVLLAIRYASDANVPALRTITRSRFNDLQAALILRIILTYLPESVDPSSYTPFCHEITSGTFAEGPQDVQLDFSILNDISDKRARARVNKAQLLPISHSAYSNAELDELTAFLIHRAHRIDSETGLFDLIPTLIVPFLEQSEYLRTWFISTCLPLLRQEYEYYPSHPVVSSLDSFAPLNDYHAIEKLLSRSLETSRTGTEVTNNIGRDIRGLVGPWVYGSTERKRRKLTTGKRRQSVAAATLQHEDSVDECATSEGHAWEYVFRWFVKHASTDFPSVLVGIEQWDGPGDVDLGGYEKSSQCLNEELQEKLELRYAQAALASAYTFDSGTAEAIEGAHSLLVRLAALMDFEPPPDLATSVDMLPRIESATASMFKTSPTALQPDSLLNPEHPLTTPSAQTFALLQIFIYSAYTLASVGHRISVQSVARLRFHENEEEQKQLLQTILHHATTTLKRDDDHWMHFRAKLLWLWNWGMEDQNKASKFAFGIFDKLDRAQFETEIFKSLLNAGRYELVVQIYIKESEAQHMTADDVEKVIIDVALQYYDTASNGNRNRGNMKKASEIISTFKPYFSSSRSFERTEALLAATHALSSYSLTQQRGVPFQPVSIRIRSDPMSLIQDVLNQNAESHTHVKDLIEIGQKLVTAGVGASETPQNPGNDQITAPETKQNSTRDRVLFMAVQVSLEKDDFRNAYSYVTSNMNAGDGQDGPWQAAFLAGEYGLSEIKPSWRLDEEVLKFLEQKLELLAYALLVAPASELPRILDVWTKCEEKLNPMRAQQDREADRLDTEADMKIPGRLEDTRKVQDQREEQLEKQRRSAAKSRSSGKSSNPVDSNPEEASQQDLYSLTRTLWRGQGSAVSQDHHPSTSELGSGRAENNGQGRKRDMVVNGLSAVAAGGFNSVTGFVWGKPDGK